MHKLRAIGTQSPSLPEIPSLSLHARAKTQEAPSRSATAFETLDKNLPQANLSRFYEAYARAVTQVRSMLTTTTPYKRPVKSRELHPFIQAKMPEVRRDKFKEGEILSKSEFIAEALKRKSPLQQASKEASQSLDEDLQLAIEQVLRRGSKIQADRAKRLEALEAVAITLEPMRDALNEQKCENARAISADFNVAWAAMIIDAMEWPDIELPWKYVVGFEVVFDVADSGVFRADPQPASISEAEFLANNTRAVKNISERIEKAAKADDEESKERRFHCWKRTKEEIEEGLVWKPKSKAQMDRKYKRGKWRCIGRNAVLQKGKWRCIDNGKSSKHNKATTMHERITCGRADFPIMVAREFARRMRSKQQRQAKGVHKKPRLRLRHGTNDLRAAYRRVPTSQPEYTCVAVWDNDNEKVVYCEVPGHNFGLTSAVVNFNRFPELATIAARRLLWCVTEHYYDDNDTTELECADATGQEVLVALCSEVFFGFPFDPGKDVIMDQANEYLGVVSDLSRAEEGFVTMDVSKKRRKKIKEIADRILREKQLRSGLASSLFGKARFLISPCFGSLGKACLQPIMEREYQRGASSLTSELHDSVEFISFLCDHLPPFELPLKPSPKERVVIFTDAEGKQRDGGTAPSGHLGFVVIHPKFGRRYAYAKAPTHWVELFDKVKERKSYIGQFELAAAITPFLSLPPEWFQGYPVELWIDNAGAVGGLIKGYSGIPDCARIINLFHFAVAKLGLASLWIDYVPSESNPADVPSRLHEMSEDEARRELREFGELVEMVIPQFANRNGEWLSSIEIARSVWE